MDEYAKQITLLTDLQNEQERRVEDLRRNIDQLAEQRRECLEILAHNAGDAETLRKLDQLEETLEEEKTKLRESEHLLTDYTRQLRTDRLAHERSEQDKLRERVERLRRRKEILRSELIPKATQHLEQLQQERRELEAQIVELSNAASKIARDGIDV